MSNYFFTHNLFKEINSTIPVFKNQIGYTMKINVTEFHNNEIHFYIHFLNNKNETIRLTHLDKYYVAFFVDAYREFILNIRYKRSKNFFTKIKNDLCSVKNLLVKREFSIFTFLSASDLLIFFFDKIYSFDRSDGNWFSKTLIRGGKVEYIFNSYYSDRKSWYFGALNLNLILTLFALEKEYSLKIIKNLLTYFRSMILFIIIIFNIYFYLDNINMLDFFCLQYP